MRYREHIFAAWARRLACGGLASLLAVSCGSDSSGVGKSVIELHACDVVPGIEISRIVGGAHIASNVDVERNYGANAFSQCTHTLDGSHKRVTVQVGRSGKPIETSRQADADKERVSDDGTGYGIKYADAIEAGRDISDLGDLAYTYEIGGTLYVVAYRDKQVEVRVWMSIGADSKEGVLQIAKEIAQSAIDQL